MAPGALLFWVLFALVALTAFVTGLGYLDRGGTNILVYSGDPLPTDEFGPAVTGGTVAFFLDSPRGGGEWVDVVAPADSLEVTPFPAQVSFVPRAADDPVLRRAFLATRAGHFVVVAKFRPAGGGPPVDYSLRVAVRETSPLARLFTEVAPIALLLLPTMLIARAFVRHRRAGRAAKLEQP